MICLTNYLQILNSNYGTGTWVPVLTYFFSVKAYALTENVGGTSPKPPLIHEIILEIIRD